MRILLYVVGIVLALLSAIGFYALFYACGRKKHEDLWDHAVLEKRGYAKVIESVDAGKKFIESHEHEEIEIYAYDGLKLRGIVVPNEKARGSVVMMHGWNSGWKLDFSSAFKLYYDLGLNLIIPDERAQGNSQGVFMTFGVKESLDTQSWVTYAAQLFGDDHPVFIGGISMGSSSVLMSADADFEENVRGIIADCGFTSPGDIMEHVIKGMSPLIPVKATLKLLNVFTRLFAGFGLWDKDASEIAKRAKLPVLIIHGMKDRFVPVEMGKKIYDNYAAEKTIVLVENAGHGMSMPQEPERVKKEVENFINENI